MKNVFLSQKYALKALLFILTGTLLSVTSCKKLVVENSDVSSKYRENRVAEFEKQISGKTMSTGIYKLPESKNTKPFTLKEQEYDTSWMPPPPPPPSCNLNRFDLILLSVQNTYVYSSCGFTNYKSIIKWQIQNNSGGVFVNNNVPDVFVGNTSGNFPFKDVSGSTTLVSTSGNLYSYETVIDYSALSVTFCSNSGFDFLVEISASCTGSAPYGLLEASFAVNFTDYCNEIPTIYVAAGPSYSVDVNGWVLICNTPCNLSASDKFEFEIRLSGTSTWSTTEYTYLTDLGNVSLGSAGTYEYRWRNKYTSGSCYGPWSEIFTITL